MGLIGGTLGAWLLRRFAPRSDGEGLADEPDPIARLTHFFGSSVFREFRGKTVADFGSGTGSVSVAVAQQVSDAQVIGIEIQPRHRERARERAAEAGVEARCHFRPNLDQPVDIILSLDAFEHFSDPAGALSTMHQWLRPGGSVLAAFGPTWLHPYGGHLFSVFPWAHLLFTEAALMHWRSNFRNDGANRFSEVEGGLNQMRVKRFEKLVRDSPLKLESLDPVPIRGLKLLALWPLREFGTSLVVCRLIRPGGMFVQPKQRQAA